MLGFGASGRLGVLASSWTPGDLRAPFRVHKVFTRSTSDCWSPPLSIVFPAAAGPSAVIKMQGAQQ
jgi:hypothetical protein